MNRDPSNTGTGPGPTASEQEDTIKLPRIDILDAPDVAATEHPPPPAVEPPGTTVSAAMVQEALEQLASLRKQLAGLRTIVRERDERLQLLERELAGREEQISELQTAARHQELELQRLAAGRSAPPPAVVVAATPLPSADERLELQLQQLSARAERYREALQHAEGYRFVFESVVHEYELKAQQAWARVATLERQLVGRVQASETDTATLRMTRDRVRELEEQLNAASTVAPMIVEPPEEQPALQRAQVRMAELETELRGWEEAIRSLYAERAAAEQREQQLHREAAERQALLSSIRAAEQELRLQLAHVSAKLAEHTARGGRPAVADPAPGQPTRLLVRTTGETGIVHVLAHRTTVGRTPDNNLQLDADFISRHHAVLLESAAGTVIEDLASTNGVYVNGERISRKMLKPGDLVTIGRTDFRFVIKPPSASQD